MSSNNCEHNNMTEVLPRLWIGGTKKHTVHPTPEILSSWRTQNILVTEKPTKRGSANRQFVCPNYGTPNMTLGQWANEIKAYKNARDKGYPTVIRDLGGHGRSGLYCAIIMSRVFGITGEEAIERLREQHCEQCVETPAQELYVIRTANELKHYGG